MKLFLKCTLLVLLFISQGCQTSRPKQQPTKSNRSTQNLFSKAQKDVRNNHNSRALKRLNQIINSNPDSDLIDDAFILKGQILFKRNQFTLAYQNFVKVIESQFYSPKETSARLWSSRCLEQLGRYDEALSVTEKIIQRNEDSPDILIATYKQRARLYSKAGDHLDALRAMIYVSQRSPKNEEKNSFKTRSIDYIQTKLGDKELKVVANDRSFGHIHAFALFAVGKKLFENKSFREAEDYFNDVIAASPETELSEKSEHFLRQIIARRKVNPKTIGVILPLSSRHKAIAQKILNGIQLGLGIFGRDRSSFNLAVIDSEANPDVARRAVERLVLEDHVVAIIGGLLSKTSESISLKAQELGVPNISLSQSSGITEIGDNIFRNALTSQMQVKHLVKTLIEKEKMKNFAILYPNDPYGVEYSNLFWDEVLRHGGKITAAQAYKTKETDFNGPIQRLVGRFYLKDRLQEYKMFLSEWLKKQKNINDRISPPDDLLSPIVDFDAIFIPDNIKAVGQIAPMLAYHEINNTKLVGTNLWNSKNLLRRGLHYVDGALFVDNLSLSKPNFKKSDFYKKFTLTFGHKPGYFETQGYDTGILLRQIIATGESTRIGLKEKLMSLGSFEGSSGPLEMSLSRELLQPLTTLAVENGKIITKSYK